MLSTEEADGSQQQKEERWKPYRRTQSPSRLIGNRTVCAGRSRVGWVEAGRTGYWRGSVAVSVATSISTQWFCGFATVALIFTGVGVPAYIIAWIAIPEVAEDEPEPPAPPASRARAALTLGIGLIVVGGLLIARTVVPWFDSSLFWPLVVVCGGLLLVLTARR